MTVPDHLNALAEFRFSLSNGLLLDRALLRQSSDDSGLGGSAGRTRAMMQAYRRFLALAADAPDGVLTVSAPLANLHARYMHAAQSAEALETLLGRPVILRRARRLPLRDPAYEEGLARYRAAFGEDPHPRIAPSQRRRLVTGLLRGVFALGILSGIGTTVVKPEDPAFLVASLVALAVGAVSVFGLDPWHVPRSD